MTTDGSIRPRARDLGLEFDGTPGPWNAITDVPGLAVGYSTVISEDDGPHAARTGVTAILPRGAAGVGDPCAAAVHSFNGNGELTGRSMIDEAGALTMPVAITNSHAVGAVHQGIDEWVARRHPVAAAAWMLPVVGETWDGYLNDLNAQHVLPAHAGAALDSAASGPLAEGNIGGGTGMNCYGFKGGTGTASRAVAHRGDEYTVGVLIQANFGAREELRYRGYPLGTRSAAPNDMEVGNWFPADLERARAAATAAPPAALPASAGFRVAGAGSAIVIVATDAPLLPGQCAALARRVPLGLARTGTTGSHFSGDIALALSTANTGALASSMDPAASAYDSLGFIPWGGMDPLFAAVVHAVDEAVWNALVAARDMTGRDGHRSPGLPHDEIRAAVAATAFDAVTRG